MRFDDRAQSYRNLKNPGIRKQKSKLVPSCLEPNIDLKVLGCEDSVCFDEVGGKVVVSQQVSQRGLVGIGIEPRP